MKKIFIVGLVLFLSCRLCESAVVTTPYVTPDDVTVTQLEQNRVALTNGINAFDGASINDSSIRTNKLSANANPENRWNEAFNDFVYTGLTIPTSASLSSTSVAGTAYVNGIRVVKDDTANTYTASKWTFVDLSDNGVFSYVEVAITDPDPSVTANSIRLARVSTDSTTVLSIRDDRVTEVSTLSVDVGYFTRDIDLGVGTQAVTGVGFIPKSIEFLSGVGTSAAFSIGHSDGDTDQGIRNNHTGSANTWEGSTTDSVMLVTGAGDVYLGRISSFDRDGFTISWTMSGNPTGTAIIRFKAMK